MQVWLNIQVMLIHSDNWLKNGYPHIHAENIRVLIIIECRVALALRRSLPLLRHGFVLVVRVNGDSLCGQHIKANSCWTPGTELANSLGEQPPPPHGWGTEMWGVTKSKSPRPHGTPALILLISALVLGCLTPAVNCVGIQGSHEALSLVQAVWPFILVSIIVTFYRVSHFACP